MFLSVELDFRRPIYPPLYSLAKNFYRERCFKFRVLFASKIRFGQCRAHAA
jgi:hypothetical protein